MRIASLEARQDQADAGSGKQEERVARLKLQLDEAAESLTKMEKGLAVNHQGGGSAAAAHPHLRGRPHRPTAVCVLGSLCLTVSAPSCSAHILLTQHLSSSCCCPAQVLTQQGAEADAARQAQLTATKALLFKASESDAALVAQEVRLEALATRADLAEAAQGVLSGELEVARQGAEAARQLHAEELKALTEKMVRGLSSIRVWAWAWVWVWFWRQGVGEGFL